MTIAGTSGDDEIAIVATSAVSGSYSVNGGPAQLYFCSAYRFHSGRRVVSNGDIAKVGGC